jgi:hypothetical protein
MQRKLWSVAVVAIAATACSDSAVLEPRQPDASAPRLALAADPLFEVVTVRTDRIPPEWAYVPVVDNFELAVARVRAGGTILVFPGTYRPAGVVIDKPVTIRAVGPEMPVIEGVEGFGSFTIRNVATGLVRVDGLRFRNAAPNAFAGIFVTGQIDRVEIENSEFYPATQPPPPGFPVGYASGVAPHRVRAAAVVIRNNKFLGGDIGVHTHDAYGTMVLDNTFDGQANAAIHDGEGGGGTHIEGNTISGCGRSWCIGTFNAASVALVRNTINIDFARPVTNAMALHGGSFRIEGNVITGTGGLRDPNDPLSWPIQSNAIATQGSAVIVGNRISGAFNGLGLGAVVATGSDNVISSVGSVLNIFRATVTLHRNDFTAYARAFQFIAEAGASSLGCNWWGTAAGPQNVDPWVDSGLYTPWSREPIANRTSVSCG